MKRILACLCLSVAFFATGEPLEAQPAPSAATAVIVFAKDGEIWRMKDDGTDKTRLTSGSVDSFPSICPFANKIVFQREAGVGASAIMIMSPTGANVTHLTPNPATHENSDPDCGSINGGTERIVFHSTRDTPDPSGDFYIMDLDGSDVIRINLDDDNNGEYERDPAWCPGKGIMFAKPGAGSPDYEIFLWTLHPVTLLPTEEEQITDNVGPLPPTCDCELDPFCGFYSPLHDRYPACRHDGAFVAWTLISTENSCDPGFPHLGICGTTTSNSDIFRLDLNDPLAEPDKVCCAGETGGDYTDDYYSSWSPGGTSLAFGSSCGALVDALNLRDMEIYTRDAAHQFPVIPLTEEPENIDQDLQPDWGELIF